MNKLIIMLVLILSMILSTASACITIEREDYDFLQFIISSGVCADKTTITNISYGDKTIIITQCERYWFSVIEDDNKLCYLAQNLIPKY